MVSADARVGRSGLVSADARAGCAGADGAADSIGSLGSGLGSRHADVRAGGIAKEGEMTEHATGRRTRVAVLGGGVMGETVLASVLAAGWALDEVEVAEPTATRAAELAATHGVRVVCLLYTSPSPRD